MALTMEQLNKIFPPTYWGNAQISDMRRMWKEIVNGGDSASGAWTQDTTYSAGDIVSEGGVVYVAINDHTAEAGDVPNGSPTQPNQIQWSTMSVLEKGGLLWNATLAYNVGDVVTESGKVYVATAVSTNKIPPDVAHWAVPAEIAGTGYTGAASYGLGNMIVADDGSTIGAYYCSTAYTSAGGGTSADFLAEKANWTPIAAIEKGGVEFDATLAYVVNDTVVDDLDNMLYRCLTAGAVTQPSATPADWEIASAPERGGVFYKESTTYLVGDIITADDGTTVDVYRATSGYLSAVGGAPADFLAEIVNWTLLSTAEIAGRLWNTASNYIIGDIVSDNVDGKIYKAIVGTNATPNTGNQPSTDLVNWEVAVTEERGGVWYQGEMKYKIGDIITADDGTNVEVYRCILDYTSAVGGNPADFLAERDTDLRWSLMETSVERGGILWDTTVAYEVGDTVIDDIDGKMYTTLVASTASQPSADLIPNWELTQTFEKGGVLYDAGIEYEDGDIVSDNSTAPRKVFMSLQGGNTGNALPIATGISAWWQELDTTFYNAPTGGDFNGDGALTIADGTTATDGGGQHCPWLSTSGDPVAAPITPNSLGEYPNTTIGPEIVGAVWRVSGLGRDAAGDSIEYLMTTGNLTGALVADGDTFTWVDGANPSEIWLWTKQARVVGERGGVLWRSGENYETGDMVIDTVTGEIFVAIVPTVPGGVPSATPTEWELARTSERGGIFYQASTSYLVGDIITADDGTTVDVYRCITNVTSAAGGAPTDFFAEILNWTLTSPVTERGGVFYQSTTDYVVGDIITADNGTTTDVQRCITDYTSAAGGAPADFLAEIANWVQVNEERGGILWATSTDYLIGDIVTEADIVYIAVTDNSAVQPSTDVLFADWILFEQERGGIFYQASTNYQIGDLVTADDGTTTEVYRAIADYTSAVGGAPADFLAEIANWTISGSERGGILWNTTTDYIIGDLVTDNLDSKIYRAITDNTSAQPSTDVLNADWVLVNQERGGIMYAGEISYRVGDIITADSDDGVTTTTDVYRCILDYSSVGTGLATEFFAEIANWVLVHEERGGVLYKADTDYQLGDVITGDDGTTSEVYRCITAYTSAAGGTDVEFLSEVANWQLVGIAEKGGVVWGQGIDYVIGDIVTEASSDAAFTCTVDHTSNIAADFDLIAGVDAANWVATSVAERGGIFYRADVQYEVGDIITADSDDGVTTTTDVYRCINLYVSAATGLATDFFAEIANWTLVHLEERGGILHDQTGVAYVVGDTTTLSGSEYLYHCILDHTSSGVIGTCLGDILHWTQQAPPRLEYNFTTNILGDVLAVPPTAPAGPHTHEHDGLTGIPDENGPHWFSIELGTGSLVSEVFIDGFKMQPSEYDTTVDGYIYMSVAVSDNSWLNVKA